KSHVICYHVIRARARWIPLSSPTGTSGNPQQIVFNQQLRRVRASRRSQCASVRRERLILKDQGKTFKMGDRVVLPPYGVGMVAGTTMRMVGGTNQQYYQVEFPNGTSKAYVPVSAPQGTGLRPALTKEEVQSVLERLQNGRITLPKQWAARHRKVTDLLT